MPSFETLICGKLYTIDFLSMDQYQVGTGRFKVMYRLPMDQPYGSSLQRLNILFLKTALINVTPQQLAMGIHSFQCTPSIYGMLKSKYANLFVINSYHSNRIDVFRILDYSLP